MPSSIDRQRVSPCTTAPVNEGPNREPRPSLTGPSFSTPTVREGIFEEQEP